MRKLNISKATQMNFFIESGVTYPNWGIFLPP